MNDESDDEEENDRSDPEAMAHAWTKRNPWRQIRMHHSTMPEKK